VIALRDNLNLFARRFALALQNSTRVRLAGPLAPPADADAVALRASDAHLPGAGWVVGMAACLSFALVGLFLRGTAWGGAVAAVVATMVTALLTGARHESSLLRAADRLEARVEGATGPRALGVIALVLVLWGKLALLAALASWSEAGVIAALFAGHVVSRAALPLLTGHLGERRVLGIAALWCAIPLLLMLAADGAAFLLVAVAAAALAGYAMRRFTGNKPGGADADDVAATQQVCELAFYLGAAIAI
jgi:adenosylcobinamide-GDP ribazoletransferase